MSTAWTIGTAGGDVTADALQGEIYTVRIGGTIRPRFKLTASAWESLRPYAEAAMEQTVMAGVNQSGKAWYRDDLGEFPNVSSLLVSLDPPASLSGAGVWAVIVGSDDRTNAAQTRHVWELECRVLADLGDYATRTDVENALKSEVL